MKMFKIFSLIVLFLLIFSVAIFAWVNINTPADGGTIVNKCGDSWGACGPHCYVSGNHAYCTAPPGGRVDRYTCDGHTSEGNPYGYPECRSNGESLGGGTYGITATGYKTQQLDVYSCSSGYDCLVDFIVWYGPYSSPTTTTTTTTTSTTTTTTIPQTCTLDIYVWDAGDFTPLDANIYIDNNFQGYNDHLAVTLNVGTYSVEATKSGYNSDQKIVSCSCGQIKRVDLYLDEIYINQPPVAIAGPDQTVYEGESVTLNGYDSYDPDGYISGYQWKEGSSIL
ncbi:MAG: hypothetical protein GF368_03750, partial [Candidatus Aenigmarchaeota archaeon]|nr:hypothetical protein [Candidatus Aenigmarchaeota archaeon]